MSRAARSFGHRRPDRKARLWALALAIGLALLAGGLLGALGRFSSAAIGLGLFAAFVGAVFAFAFHRTAAEMVALRGGVGVVGRWTVPPATFDLFRSGEARLERQGGPNGWHVPLETPPGGVEVIVGKDCLVIGDTYFGLPASGLSRITGVDFLQGNPPCIAFTTVTKTLTPYLASKMLIETGTVRIPIAPATQTEAGKVFNHYSDLIAGRIVPRAEGWRARMRWGLALAAFFPLLALAGIALHALELGHPLLGPGAAITGIMGTLGALVIALQGWVMARPRATRR